jgi:uncharacterized protein YndB with AHSA1/START domain
MTHDLTIELDDHVPLLRLTRDFDASPDVVFRAWAQPDLVARWLGPRDREMLVERYDCVTGGSYRYVHRRGDDDQWFHGSFHEVRPGELIVQTFTWEGMPDHVALERVLFSDLGDGLTRMTSTSLVDSFEGRDAFVASGMETGVRDSFAMLDEILADDNAMPRATFRR